PVFVVLERLKAERAAQVVNGLRTLALVEAHQEPVKLVLLQAVLIALLKKVIVELVSLTQALAVDLCQLGQQLPVAMVTPRVGFQALVRPAVIPAAIAQL